MKYRTKRFNEQFKRLTHYLFRYPAKFHPPVAKFLVETYSKPGMVVIDPFCGSGTLLVEGVIAKRRMIGVDLDPVAAFVARVKATPIRDSRSISLLREFSQQAGKGARDTAPSWIPAIPNIDHWFEPHVLKKMGQLWAEIAASQLLDTRTRPIAQIAFLSRIRNWSNADPVPVSGLEVTKHIRKLRQNGHDPDVRSEYRRALDAATARLEEFTALTTDEGELLDVSSEDARAYFQRTRRQPDVLITSPPYLTAVDYYRRHTLEMYWLIPGLDQEARRSLRSLYIGQYRATKKMSAKVGSTMLSAQLERRAAEIECISQARANAFRHYFRATKGILKAASKRILRGGNIVIVIGDGKIADQNINTGRLLANEIKEFVELQEIVKYPVVNRYMTYSRHNDASIEVERMFVFRNRRR